MSLTNMVKPDNDLIISNYQTKGYEFDIEIPTSVNEITKRLRSMSMEEANQKETPPKKLEKITEEQKFREDPMEITKSNSAEQIEYQPQIEEIAVQQQPPK